MKTEDTIITDGCGVIENMQPTAEELMEEQPCVIIGIMATPQEYATIKKAAADGGLHPRIWLRQRVQDLCIALET
jgi:hypothetical protein